MSSSDSATAQDTIYSVGGLDSKGLRQLPQNVIRRLLSHHIGRHSRKRARDLRIHRRVHDPQALDVYESEAGFLKSLPDAKSTNKRTPENIFTVEEEARGTPSLEDLNKAWNAGRLAP
jgi:hypothetical protein